MNQNIKIVFQIIVLLLAWVTLLPGDKSISLPENKTDRIHSYIEQCKIHLSKGNADDAIYYAQKAIGLDENRSQSYYWLGHAYGLKAQSASIFGKFLNARKCKKAWLTAIELDSDNLNARMGLFNYYLQAPKIAGGGLKLAAQQAKDIKKISPIRGHLALGAVYQKKNEFIKAEQEYLKSTRIKPENPEPYFNLGYLYQTREKFQKAKDAFENILKLEPDNPLANYQMGRTILLSGKDLQKGIGFFQKYLTSDPPKNHPTRADAHWRMGMIYQKLKQNDQAKSHYKTALKLDPKHSDSWKALKNMD